MKNTIGIILIITTIFCAPFSSRADLLSYSLTKGSYFHQEAGGAPVLRPYLPWVFESRMVFTNKGVFTYNVNLTKSGSFNPTILTPANGIDATGNTYNFPARYSQQSFLDANSANGTYVFTVKPPLQATVTVSNTIVAGTFPTAPNITNLTAAQSIDPSQDFTLKWDAFPGGTTNDIIICWLKSGTSNVVETPSMPGFPGALDGTATSLLIPVGTLAPGRAYLGRLVFAAVKSVVTNQYPGAVGAMMYASQTDFYIKTAGPGDNNPPMLVSTFPAQGATGVPTNTSVWLKFSKPMGGGGLSDSWTGFFGPLGVLGWTPDGFVLGGGTNSFSPNSMEKLVINLLPDVPMYDLSGNIISPETTLTFTTGTGHHKPVAPVISNATIDFAGRFQADLLCETNGGFIVEYSTNLVNWNQLTTGFAVDGVIHFGDASLGVRPEQGRFFRAIAY